MGKRYLLLNTSRKIVMSTCFYSSSDIIEARKEASRFTLDVDDDALGLEIQATAREASARARELGWTPICALGGGVSLWTVAR